MASSSTPPSEALIVFTPSGKRGRFPKGTAVLQAARELGVDVDSVCGGRAICGRCQIHVGEGEFAKHGIHSGAQHLSPRSAAENRYDELRGLAPNRRLSCQCLILDDVVVDVPPESQVHKQVVRKQAEIRDMEMDPATRLYYVVVDEPDMHHPSSDLERLLKALHQQWGLADLTMDLGLIQKLQGILRKGAWAVTAAIHFRNGSPTPLITGLWPGFHARILGLAVDIGSTTVAAHLVDLSDGAVLASGGLMNPQIRFGEDLMSRVSYVMMNPGGDAEMTAAIRAALNQLAISTALEAHVAVADIVEIVLVGNPVMHHLLLGIDPTELGGAPFALATGLGLTLKATQLDLTLNPGAMAYILPCIAGHVGADAAAVALAEAPQDSDEILLVVDVGTNAEILLGSKARVVACSSPTGPAFEGAQISSGQRAAPGAIERIRIDAHTLEPRYKVIGCDLWSDEVCFSQATAATGVTGICGSGIIEVIAEMYLAGVITQDGQIDGSLAARSPRVVAAGRTFSYVISEGSPPITITQNDVRAIQLAKAALYAGIKLLMEKLGVTKVDRIRLAGAFGAHIDVKYAMILGLIPDCALENVSSAGNAAGTGARMALLSMKARDHIEDVVRKIEKIETAVEVKFQQHFVEAMALPHKVDAFPHLARVVQLPPLKTIVTLDEAGQGRRPRRRG